MFNTIMRANTNFEHEKNLFKLLNNSIFGKTLEQVENHIDVKICGTEKQLMKNISKPNYKSFNIFPNNIAAVHMNKTEIYYNKPIAIGFAVLELSKVKIADFHYNVIKKKYGDKAQLLFTDTDSLTYHIETENIDNDMKNESLNKHFDFSNYDKKHPLYNEKNKNIIGFFKDENGSNTVDEFCGHRSKLYIMTVHKIDEKTGAKNIGQKNTCKGVKNANKLKIDDYKKCIFTTNPEEMKKYSSYNIIRSVNHNLNSTTINKISLSAYDDKRFYLNSIESLSHGHYKTLPIIE